MAPRSSTDAVRSTERLRRDPGGRAASDGTASSFPEGRPARSPRCLRPTRTAVLTGGGLGRLSSRGSRPNACVEAAAGLRHHPSVEATSMDLAEVVGQLAELRRFPVEELGGEAPQIALLDGGGMVGHPAFELRDAETGLPPDASAVPTLRSFSARYPDSLVPGSLDAWALVRVPDGREYPVLDPTWTAELSGRLPRPLVLQRRGAGTPPTLS